MTLTESTETLSGKFETLKQLTILKIIGGYLEIIRNDTFTSSNNKLEELEITSCSIFLIEPKTFVSLINLRELNLSNNTLMRIAPGTFDGLSNLEILQLQRNNIYKIKDTALNGLINLQIFDVFFNDVTEGIMRMS
ncbi:P-granule-associated novel protein 1-like [Aphidius gifuensis]|uniref:P-granule-associated novel protein 1-like n=1 Tax=Aphidius gifuensis TaxID=684658 RepID=UPI001CDCD6B6|nr:P-granule-associated novel protein 1-like [Aphidius gifuensis]